MERVSIVNWSYLKASILEHWQAIGDGSMGIQREIVNRQLGDVVTSDAATAYVRVSPTYRVQLPAGPVRRPVHDSTMEDVTFDARHEPRIAFLSNVIKYSRRIVARWPDRTVVTYLGEDRDFTISLAASGLSMNDQNIIVDRAGLVCQATSLVPSDLRDDSDVDEGGHIQMAVDLPPLPRSLHASHIRQ